MQREHEKSEKDYQVQLEKHEQGIERLKEQHTLEMKNNLLEQKLQFNNKIEILKEENFSVQQNLMEKIKHLLTVNNSQNVEK